VKEVDALAEDLRLVVLLDAEPRAGRAPAKSLILLGSTFMAISRSG